jgi:hypothetical protein
VNAWDGTRLAQDTEKVGPLQAQKYNFRLRCTTRVDKNVFQDDSSVEAVDIEVVPASTSGGGLRSPLSPLITADLKVLNLDGPFLLTTSFGTSSLRSKATNQVVGQIGKIPFTWTSSGADTCVGLDKLLPSSIQALGSLISGKAGSIQVLQEKLAGTYLYTIHCTSTSIEESASDTVEIEVKL